MSTYRERREARAERLRDWAERREAKSAAAFRSAHERADMIPFGQPILVGHHSEKRHRRDLGRIDSAIGRGVEHARKAESMQSRAANIESQLGQSIYSDDPDAIPALEARLAGLEAERDRIKAYNASVRRGKPNPELLDAKQRGQIRSIASVGFAGKGGAFPAYHLSNLSGNIKRNRDRLEELRRRAGSRSAARRETRAVELAWEPSREVRGLQGAMIPDVPVHRVQSGNVVQEGLFRREMRELERERRRRSRQAKGQLRRRDGRFR